MCVLLCEGVREDFRSYIETICDLLAIYRSVLSWPIGVDYMAVGSLAFNACIIMVLDNLRLFTLYT
jgi:hypothetical protein